MVNYFATNIMILSVTGRTMSPPLSCNLEVRTERSDTESFMNPVAVERVEANNSRSEICLLGLAN